MGSQTGNFDPAVVRDEAEALLRMVAADNRLPCGQRQFLIHWGFDNAPGDFSEEARTMAYHIWMFTLSADRALELCQSRGAA